MPTPFLGEIKIMSFGYAPQGWAKCEGQLLPINQNQALFSLMGTTYGGNGQTNFALPDLRGRTPIHRGNFFTQGQAGGQTAHTLIISEIPTHTHTVNAKSPSDSSGNTNLPGGNYLSNSAPAEIYHTGSGNPSLLTTIAGTVTNVGGSQPHNNWQPSLALNFCVALSGIFPSQN